MNELEPILKYKMNDFEAKAFKIGLMWEDECKKNIFFDKYEKFKKGSDPRKTNLFKYCYKLSKEIYGIIPDNEIQLYIRAQIQVLKSIKEGKTHALISPHCLVGKKAWTRWKLWKRIYNKNLNKNLTSEEVGIKIKESVIQNEFKRTYSFLKNNKLFERNNYFEKINEISRFISNGEISPFYVVLSPWIKIIFKEIPVDIALYKPSITPSLENKFKEKFNHEF